MNLIDKEKKLNKLKQILQDYIAKSKSADDDSPFVLDSKEQAKVDEFMDKINKMEVRINELKKEGGDTDAKDQTSNLDMKLVQKIGDIKNEIISNQGEIDKLFTEMESILKK